MPLTGRTKNVNRLTGTNKFSVTVFKLHMSMDKNQTRPRFFKILKAKFYYLLYFIKIH